MRGNLVEREPERIDHWKKIGLYEKIQAKNSGGKALFYTTVLLSQTATFISDTH